MMMRKPWSLKDFLVGAAVGAVVFAVSSSAAQAEDRTLTWPKNSQFTCSGVLTVQDGELQLNPDPGSKTWCDASFNGEQYQVAKSDIAKRVKAVCAEGDRCQVKGTIEGHGVFYWTKITSVKKLEGR
jgi:hypothetical protein